MSKRPNVLLITVDHWPARLLGSAGHPVIQTPTLDELAKSGASFSNCYAECPVCIPARRSLMTGTTPRTHGDRVFKETLEMPNFPTMAQTFRDAGYQAFGVGKLHVYPQRNRIGFDDVILDEEGRCSYGSVDDYELYLGDEGYAGQQYDHGMSNNEYCSRPWHLPDETHATNWATRNIARVIKRRDPTRPAFWFLSYRHPHPPLVPLRDYLDMYQGLEIDEPVIGKWARSEGLPYKLQSAVAQGERFTAIQTEMAKRAFYALCTHLDHSLRVVIGTLREEGLLDDTVICFTSDHGDMLGDHNIWAKRSFYEGSANVPMILLGTAGDERVGFNKVDERLCGWRDVMPTLLDLASIDIPDTVEGLSMIGEEKREWFYGEVGEGDCATRMIRDSRYKLIYYATGNARQLFDMENDPRELVDLSKDSGHAEILDRLTGLLISELYGEDLTWIKNGQLVGRPSREFQETPNRGLTSQRGSHWPPPPKSDMPQI
ncbi:MAG: sulfatase-like hydrolase/transferase [Opitutales bacterium]|nr:sulfatase-like hydrolase/transferase [Opitutales bacterium]